MEKYTERLLTLREVIKYMYDRFDDFNKFDVERLCEASGVDFEDVEDLVH